ncbi:MAG: efflux protein ApaG, partial [Acidobacteria bacterium]|nr:efflux protein ApaG [Acidobacteriota bacterium]
MESETRRVTGASLFKPRGERAGERNNSAPDYNRLVSDTTTRGIRIQIASFYVEERSEPRESYFFFAYRVRISNAGPETAQLISREWIITDSDGHTERVQGEGVVGQQPVL